MTIREVENWTTRFFFNSISIYGLTLRKKKHSIDELNRKRSPLILVKYETEHKEIQIG